MRRRITFSVALVVSLVLVSLTSSDLTARAQQQRRTFVWDSGVVTLGPNQALRVLVDRDTNHDGNILVGFRRFDYVQANCNGGVCKHMAANPNPAAVTQELMPGEAATLDITPMPGSSGVRAVVVSNRRNVRVSAQIIDTNTGRVVATFTAGQDARMDSF